MVLVARFRELKTRKVPLKEIPMSSNHLLDTAEAAEYLGVSKAFLERDRWAGPSIPFVRIGSRTVRYRACDLESYVAGRSSKNIPPEPHKAI